MEQCPQLLSSRCRHRIQKAGRKQQIFQKYPVSGKMKHEWKWGSLPEEGYTPKKQNRYNAWKAGHYSDFLYSGKVDKSSSAART